MTEAADNFFVELLAQCVRRIEDEGIDALEAMCAEHTENADRLRAGIHALRAIEPVLDNATVTVLPSHDEKGGGQPERIGSYKILSKLGEGGMGTVYLGEQKEPVRRRAAIKVIKLGMDSKQVLARFELERQALAVMNHPTIAKVFDAGTTERGQPYFAMEFVEGAPLTDYCKKHKLTLEARLQIFCQICQGVQHAHQKGILHRDLKPSNILVSRKDEQHAVKLIDFGLARATNQQLVEHTIFTAEGVLIGTPEYMSPEQASGDAFDIDTRTDVYSLGVILYELLTGTLPFDSESLRKAGLAEVMRVIQEDDPPRPSTKITKSDGSGSEHARYVRMAPGPYRRRIHGELDWIVMRTIAKEPERRYESALSLSKDIGRYLAGEPVEAGPLTARYRVGKFVRRHRIQVGAAAMVSLSLVVGIIAFAVENSRANANARIAADNAKKALSKAEEADRERQHAVAATREKDAANAALQKSLARSEGLRLVNESVTNLAEDPTLALLLAIEATERRPGPVANSALLNALQALHEHKTLHGSTTAAASVALSADGSRALAVCFGGTVRVWDVATGRGLTLPTLSYDAVMNRAGTSILTTPNDLPSQLWDAATGALQLTLADQASNSGAFSPNGKLVVTADSDSLKVFDATSGNLVRTLNGQFRHVSFDPGGRRVAAASVSLGTGRTYFLQLLDLDHEEATAALTHAGLSRAIDHIAFSRDGQRVVTTAFNSATVWNLKTKEMLAGFASHKNVQDQSKGMMTSSCFSSDGHRVLSATATPRIWDVKSRVELLAFPRHRGGITAAWFSPDSTTVLTAAAETRAAKLWDAHSGLPLMSFPTHGPDAFGVASATFSASGNRAITGGWNGSVQVWDVHDDSTKDLGFDLEEVNTSFVAPMFSRDGNRCLAIMRSRQMRVWDVATGKPIAKNAAIFGTFVGSGDKILQVTAGLTGEAVIQLVVVDSGKVLYTIHQDDLSILDGQSRLRQPLPLATGPRGELSLSADSDFNLQLWSLKRRAQTHVLRGHTGRVLSGAFHPDATRIVTGSMDGTARVWDTTTGKTLLTLRDAASKSPIHLVGFGPSGQTIVTACEKVATLWDAERGTRIATFSGHLDLLTSVRVSPDETLLLSTSKDKTAILWNTNTGNRIATIGTEDDYPIASSFRNDGDEVVTLSARGALRRWPTNPLLAARQRKPRELMYHERERFEILRPSDATAKAIVDKLFATLFVCDEVIATLKEDPSLEHGEREIALQMAAERGDPEARVLEAEAWSRARQPEANRQQVQQVLPMARAAYRLKPDDHQCLRTLGAVLYRLGEYSEALTHLRRAEVTWPQWSTALPFFLAMTHHRLGQNKEAKKFMVQCEDLMQQNSKSEILQGLLSEARKTLADSGH